MNELDAFNRAFQIDPNIDEIGFVGWETIDDAGSSSVTSLSHEQRAMIGCGVFLMDSKLGLSYRCIPKLYMQAFARLSDARHGSSALEMASLTAEQRATLQSNTRAMLVVNADNYSALNTRKRLVECGHLTLQSELQFLDLLLTKHPKSGDCWSHRRWIVAQLFSNVESLPAVKVLRHEFGVVSRVANVYPRCYYAWNYRIWLVEHLSTLCASLTTTTTTTTATATTTQQRTDADWFEPFVLVCAELFDAAAWLRRHIGDGSAYSHRRFLLVKLLSLLAASSKNQQHKITSILHAEFNLLKHIISFYPGHPAAWLHRRFVFYNFHQRWRLVLSDFGKVESAIRSIDNDASNNDDSVDYDLDADDVSTKLASFVELRRRMLNDDDRHESLDESECRVICGIRVKPDDVRRTPSTAATAVDVDALIASELRFALACLVDRKVERYARQQEGAVGYIVWMLRLLSTTGSNSSHLDLLKLLETRFATHDWMASIVRRFKQTTKY